MEELIGRLSKYLKLRTHKKWEISIIDDKINCTLGYGLIGACFPISDLQKDLEGTVESVCYGLAIFAYNIPVRTGDEV